jgi:small subunit ribosomal protein S15
VTFLPLVKDRKKKLIEDFKNHERDTGSASVQIALLTERINLLSEHFKNHKRDHHSRQGLLRLVNTRRRLLDYLKRKNEKAYQDIIKKLELRK